MMTPQGHVACIGDASNNSMIYCTYSTPSNIEKKIKNLQTHYTRYKEIVSKKAFAFLPWETSALRKTAEFKLPKDFSHLVVVGMGGSSLGTKALVETCDVENVFFLDNTDPDFVHAQLSKINPKKTLFLLISKSGETLEVLALSEIILSKISSPKNFIIIADTEKSALGILGKKHSIPILKSPAEVPGRFSVLSLVGQLPAHLAGISGEKILKGAQNTSWEDAYALACHQYLQFKDKKNITVFFPYAERLTSFADWYIQLLAESIGKSKKVGITIVKALGAKDQHSQLQLFLDGPSDKWFIFIKPKRALHDTVVPSHRLTLNDIYSAEYDGVKKTFIKNKKPFAELTFDKITPEILGELFFLFELQIAFLGELLSVNIENQPAVEFSKKYTKNILESLE